MGLWMKNMFAYAGNSWFKSLFQMDGKAWLKDLFEHPDKHSWLQGMHDNGEIDANQWKWLQELLEEKEIAEEGDAEAESHNNRAWKEMFHRGADGPKPWEWSWKWMQEHEGEHTHHLHLHEHKWEHKWGKEHKGEKKNKWAYKFEHKWEHKWNSEKEDSAVEEPAKTTAAPENSAAVEPYLDEPVLLEEAKTTAAPENSAAVEPFLDGPVLLPMRPLDQTAPETEALII